MSRPYYSSILKTIQGFISEITDVSGESGLLSAIDVDSEIAAVPSQTGCCAPKKLEHVLALLIHPLAFRFHCMITRVSKLNYCHLEMKCQIKS